LAENIHLACRGWQHAHWLGSFYPDDLPIDWQLSYYSNAFDSVVIPGDYWSADILEQAYDWCDQVPVDFRFYVEWPAALEAAAVPQFCSQLEAMADNLAGLLVNAAPGSTALLALQQRLPTLQVYGAQDFWLPDSVAQPSDAPLAVLARPWRDLRELRYWLEAFAPKHAAARQALLCTMPQPDSAQLQQARTLLDIMGL
jgi:hypothetical protein